MEGYIESYSRGMYCLNNEKVCLSRDVLFRNIIFQKNIKGIIVKRCVV